MSELAAYKKSLDKFYKKFKLTGFWGDKYPDYLKLYTRKYHIRNWHIDKYILGEKTLDIGCGLGDVLKIASKKATVSVGIELSATLIQQAKLNLSATGIRNAYLVLSSGEILPFKDNTFDCIILADVIEHLLNPEECFSEIKRVSKKNMRLILTTPRRSIEKTWKVIDSILLFPLEVFKKISKKDQEFQITNYEKIKEKYFSPKELKKILVRNGLEIEKHYFIEFYPGSEGSGFFGRVFLRTIHSIPLLNKKTNNILEIIFSFLEKLKFFNSRQVIIARGKDEKK